MGKKGSTNMLRLESIGPVLVRGYRGYGKKVEGEVVILMSADLVKPESVKNKIIVIPTSHEKFIPFMKESIGIILENPSGDISSEKHAIEIAKTFDIPLIIRADNATTLLTEKQRVVLNPKKALVYKSSKKKKA